MGASRQYIFASINIRDVPGLTFLPGPGLDIAYMYIGHIL